MEYNEYNIPEDMKDGCIIARDSVLGQLCTYFYLVRKEWKLAKRY